MGAWLCFVWMYMWFGGGLAAGLAPASRKTMWFTVFFWPFVLGGFVGEYFRVNTEDNYGRRD